MQFDVCTNNILHLTHETLALCALLGYCLCLDVQELTLHCRMLAKQVQTELAQANSVADEALATMTTVRAHAAGDSARAAYAVKLAKFYSLQVVCLHLP